MKEIASYATRNCEHEVSSISPCKLEVESASALALPSVTLKSHRTAGAPTVAMELLQERRDEPLPAMENAEMIACLWRLTEFVSPSVATIILRNNDTHFLNRHRSEIAVVFCDLRGFTRFTDIVPADEAEALLYEYHRCLDRLFHLYDATLYHRAGDGAMVFVGDPIMFESPRRTLLHAARLATDLRAKVNILLREWQTRGYELGFGVGLTYGVATIGVISNGFRADYTY